MTEQHPTQQGTTVRRISLLSLVLASVMAGGCASLPEEQARAELNDASAYATDRTFDQQQNPWPQQNWWQAYGDQQLNAMMAEALASSPDLTIARARFNQAAATLGLSRSANQPNLTADASISEEKQTYNGIIPGDFTPQGWNSYGRLALDLSWDLDFWGKNRSAIAAATSELTAREAELAQARLVLTSAIASSYAELNRLYLSRDTAARSLAVRSKTAELFAQREKYGMENIGTVRQAEARKAQAEGVVLALDEQIGVQCNQLAALLGKGPDRGLSIERPQLSLNEAFGLPQQLGFNLLGRRPDIVAARLRVEEQNHMIDSRKAAFYPDVNLTAFVGYQSLGIENLFDDGSDIGGVGPAISLPIFNGGRLRSDLRNSEALYDIAVASYNSAVTHAYQEVADVIIRTRSLTTRIEKAQLAVEKATEAHQVAKNRYEGGLASNLQVLSAEDALLQSREALTNLKSQAFILDVALNKSLGGGYQIDTASVAEADTQQKPLKQSSETISVADKTADNNSQKNTAGPQAIHHLNNEF